MTAIVLTGIALVISLALTALLIRAAPRLGLVDHPEARKFHQQPTPKGGGLAIAGAFALTMGLQLLVSPPDFGSHSLLVFLGLSFLIVALGLLDDLLNLPWQLRLGMQTTVAGVAVVCVVSPDVLGIPEPILGGVAAVLWIVALVNAFNMLDNMDALSASSAWIAAGTFAMILLVRGGDGLPYLLLMGALAGFLCFNRPPARIFMGDAGSTFLGFFLGVRSLSDGFLDPERPWSWLGPLCVLAVPLYDQGTVVALRLWQGRSPFHADKQHFSHRLVALGLKPAAAVGVIALLGLVSGAVGLAIVLGSPWVACWLGAGLLGVWVIVACVEYAPRFQR